MGINLSDKALALWGKKTVEDGQELWLPLIAHMIDTKNVINWLYNHWLSDGQRLLLQEGLTEEESQNLVKFLGFIHDIGKATPAFQTKRSYGRNDSLDQDILENLVRKGFSGIDSLLLADPQESPHNRAGEAILENFGLDKSLAAIIGGHHGKPESRPPRRQLNDYTANYWQTDLPSNEQDEWKRIQHELIEYGLRQCGFSSLEEIPSVEQQQAVILTGMVIMADWIASSEYLDDDKSKPLFPLIPLDKGFSDLSPAKRYQNGILTWKNEDTWEPHGIKDIPKQYGKRWGFAPKPVQRQMSEKIGLANDPGIVIVEAPMGVGKTEVALTAAEQLAEKTGRSGLFMGLPTQATSNAMFSRVESWLKSLGTEQKKNLAIKLMHSKARFNTEYMRLGRARNIGENVDSSVIVNSWFSGKKSILEEFTIGTIDNLLQMGLKQRHLFLKHLGFSGKVIIIDEVHAYDVYMTSYLDKALEWLGAYHVPVVVLSATLPVSRRNELLSAYFLGKFNRKKKDWSANQSYPLLSMLDGDRLIQTSDFDPQSTKRIEVRRIDGDEQTAIQSVLGSIRDGGIAGVIVNTVKRAQALASLVPSDVTTIVLHSAFLATDRVDFERQLQKLIGKDGERPSKLVVIGTQVLEQSLDIDFDVLFTDIAPMDLILQRAGRLHRHGHVRPSNLSKPVLYVMGANSYGNYGSANEAVYEKYLLTKTDYFLKDSISIPRDIPTLVQKVYDQSVDAGISDLEESKSEFNRRRKKLRAKARIFQIASPMLTKTIHGWLDREQLGLDKDENKAAAAVRDIQETVEMILLMKKEDEYYLLDGRRIDDLPKYDRDREIAAQIIRLPTALTPEWQIDSVIDKLETNTVRNFGTWQSSIWLRGSLALVLNQDFETSFNGWKLKYSPKIGLSYEKEEAK
ncbi:CRISPR-associated helicase Cas3' [Parascardovia denticolens]